MRASEDWMAAWQPMVEAVGREFGADRPLLWGPRIEASAVARYIEPLELDCQLHADESVARAHGYDQVVVPYTALTSLCIPLVWSPGDAPVFSGGSRNTPVAASPLGAGNVCGIEPRTTHTFAVGWDMEFLAAAVVGDRLCRRGVLLVSCVPKELKVGRGAFVTLQSEVIDERHRVIARMRNTLYRFNPKT